MSDASIGGLVTEETVRDALELFRRASEEEARSPRRASVAPKAVPRATKKHKSKPVFYGTSGSVVFQMLNRRIVGALGMLPGGVAADAGGILAALWDQFDPDKPDFKQSLADLEAKILAEVYERIKQAIHESEVRQKVAQGKAIITGLQDVMTQYTKAHETWAKDKNNASRQDTLRTEFISVKNILITLLPLYWENASQLAQLGAVASGLFMALSNDVQSAGKEWGFDEANITDFRVTARDHLHYVQQMIRRGAGRWVEEVGARKALACFNYTFPYRGLLGWNNYPIELHLDNIPETLSSDKVHIICPIYFPHSEEQVGVTSAVGMTDNDPIVEGIGYHSVEKTLTFDGNAKFDVKFGISIGGMPTAVTINGKSYSSKLVDELDYNYYYRAPDVETENKKLSITLDTAKLSYFSDIVLVPSK
ncbi:insecticidal delta-endotoxin Cry8Ea1 family protein [Spirillospora sp. NPDC052269]